MFSRSTLFVGILAIGLVTGLGIGPKLKVSKLKLPITKKLESLHQQTEVLAALEPTKSQSCFNYYTPILNKYTFRYEVDFDLCLSVFNSSSTEVTEAWNSTLYQIQNGGDKGCSEFKECRSFSDLDLAFRCFAESGAEQSKVLFQVSANVTEVASFVKISLLTLQTQLDSCVNHAQREYIEDTSSTYEQLNNCLKGAPLPEVTTTTTTTTYTTPEPTQSTY
ncbi:uncharacterized protein [Drosophila bipectinata]|uniref:uncharacterized protein n=1 Tax=Drosophila bipectinata TaxID=42026 RepID=UPI001C89D0CE|nr:uncharacterized protein LOC108128043 [Drosophila bipectinata]